MSNGKVNANSRSACEQCSRVSRPVSQAYKHTDAHEVRSRGRKGMGLGRRGTRCRGSCSRVSLDTLLCSQTHTHSLSNTNRQEHPLVSATLALARDSTLTQEAAHHDDLSDTAACKRETEREREGKQSGKTVWPRLVESMSQRQTASA